MDNIPLTERGQVSLMASGTNSPLIGLYHFALLIWKGFLLRKRHYIVTFLELLIPILFASIPVIIHAEIQKAWKPRDNFPNPYDNFVDPSGSRYQNATYYKPFDPRQVLQIHAGTTVYIIFTPNSTASTNLTNSAVKFWQEKALLTIKNITGVATEADLDDEALKILSNEEPYADIAIIGLVYSNFPRDNGSPPRSLNYKIRYYNWYSNFHTESKYPPFRINAPSSDNEYSDTFFLAVQASVDHAFINMHAKGKGVKTEVTMQQFPYPPYEDLEDRGSPVLSQAGLFWCYGFVALSIVIVKRVIDEKANRSKELLKMMGMTDCVYWSSTFTNFFIIPFFKCIVLTILYKIPFYGGDAFLSKSDSFLVFIVLLIISAASVLFCLVVTTFLNRSTLGISIILVLWMPSASLLSTFLFDMKKYLYLNLSSRLSVCLLPTGAALVAFRFFSVLESSGAGAQWNNLTDFIVTPDQNLLMVMGMIILSCIIYGVLLWYIDAVWPWQYGIPKPFYFPFTKAFWCGERRNKLDEEESAVSVESREFFEEEPTGTSPGIIIDHLTKVFRTGITSKVAVEDISMKIYCGQITAVLGHNGAGKTTTINMLTGLFPPTKGTASVDGWDILTQINSARRSLGICPQHNVLYDDLTAEEHLMLYAGLKGVKFNAVRTEAAEILRLLKLEDKSGELSQTLSGGMKRKLSLGIAIIGGSKVLFLDEPTSGMDPEARRSVWDTLLSIRNDRTIVLTTHYMEEADVLGDRIAIMAAGKIQCYGTPMFLKRKFGTGYHLHIAKEEKCSLEEVTRLLRNYVPEANLESTLEREATYSFLGGDPSYYGKMFMELETQKENLGIASFGMSVTTMEDVFIRVSETSSQALKRGENGMSGELSDEVQLMENGGSAHSGGHIVFEPFTKLVGLPLLQQQMKALLLKRFYHAKRHWGVWFTRLIFPFFLVFLMVWVMYIIQAPPTAKPLVIDLKATYGNSKGFYFYNKTEARRFAENYLKHELQASGVDAVKVTDPEEFVVNFGKDNILDYINNLFIGGSVTTENDTFFVNAWFNPVPYHTAPITLNAMDTALLRYVSGSQDASIKLTNAPFSFGIVSQGLPSDYYYAKFVAVGFLPLVLSYISCSFIFVPVYENVSKAKLLQLMTGVATFTYWLMMFVWDFMIYCACCLIFLIPFAFFNGHVFFGQPESIGTILFLLLLHGWGAIPLSYIASLVFKKPSTGFNVLTTIEVIAALIAAVVLAILENSFHENRDINISLWALRLIPTFGATWGLGNVFVTSLRNAYCDNIPPRVLQFSCPSLKPTDSMFKCCKDFCGTKCFRKLNPMTMEWYGCGRDAVLLFFDGILFFAILLLLDSSRVKRMLWRAVQQVKSRVVPLQPNTGINVQDDDVLAEENRVSGIHTGQANSEALLVVDLTRYYNGICAVDHLKFGVHMEECFGLLGINGAGKTSTFKMLTGDIQPTEGNAYLRNSNLYDNIKEFQKYLGYCPQFDALVDLLNGREMLTLFARLRGVPESSIEERVSELIKMVDLQEYSEKPTKVYSGGNKRKLSLALALIGNPSLILLDEPTSGVDPVARRKIWSVLSQARTISGSSIILTTHSMEESEALCSRLAIMVNGQFRCIGSIQHLKSKFGQGFSIVVKVKKEHLIQDPSMMTAKNCIQGAFPSASLKDDHQGMLHYHIPDTSVPWSQMFNKMEEIKDQLQLDDYQISDTTLEQIFLAFARGQRVSTEVSV